MTEATLEDSEVQAAATDDAKAADRRAMPHATARPARLQCYEPGKRECQIMFTP
jgi:hypothetical protein